CGWTYVTRTKTTSSGREHALGCRPMSRGRLGRRGAAQRPTSIAHGSGSSTSTAGPASPGRTRTAARALSPPTPGFGAGDGPRAHGPHHINTTYVGLMHAGPTLIARGTDEQKAYHLPRILSGEALWCQGFSEPNAGSDLASLTTRGVVDGTDVVVTGVKMWTTDAQHADFQELLVRTDPGSRRHHGLTWLICDMRSPGIEIRPIRTMLLDEHVNTVFYDAVKIPRTDVVGELGDGWAT